MQKIMKTTLKFILRNTKGYHGTGRLALQVTRHRVTRTISMPYVLSSAEWDESRQTINRLKQSSYTRKTEIEKINENLQKDLLMIRKSAEILEARGDYSSQDLAECFRKQRQGQLFCEYIDRKVENLNDAKRFGTAHTYHYAVVSLRKFLGGKDICIDKVTAGLMKNYEQYLQTEEKSKNTISCYMRSLHAAYNQAVNENVFIPEETKSKPFSGVFTGNAKTQKRAIGVEEILQLTTQSLNPSTPQSLSFSRDLFLFSFYTQGMSFSDMANLKTENIKDGFIRYNRKKTGQQITVKLEACMKEIIERYSDAKSNLIFPVLRKYSECSESVQWKKTSVALAAHNKNLDKLAGLTGISSRLTSYVARHSWASIASQKGVPVATISKGMGHESEKTTRIYISQLDHSDVDRANRQILSCVTNQCG